VRLSGDPTALGVLASRRVGDSAASSGVTLDGERVLGFAKPSPGPGLVSGGVYALGREALDIFAEGGPDQPQALDRLAQMYDRHWEVLHYDPWRFRFDRGPVVRRHGPAGRGNLRAEPAAHVIC
jgi:hypothetical protein